MNMQNINAFEVMDILYNKNNYKDLLLVVVIILCLTAILIFSIFGNALPKNLLIWHIYFCLFIICLIEIKADEYIIDLLNNIVKENNDKKIDIKIDKLYFMSNKTLLNMILFSMIISIISYIYPEYSVNSYVKTLMFNDNNNQYVKEDVYTEFKINKTINSFNDIDNSIKKSNTYSSIDVNNLDSNLDVFNRIKQIDKIK